MDGQATQQQTIKKAWVVLLTRTSSYLSGVLVLAHTFRKVKSKYPLICAIDDGIDAKTRALLVEGGCVLRSISLLSPKSEMTYIAERFQDTWTKLVVFDFDDMERVVMVDADMIIRKNCDDLFDIALPDDGNGIASVHTCVCNTPAKWCPPEWTNDACCYTSKNNPKAAESKFPNDPAGLINSGLVALKPNKQDFEAMVEFLYTSPLIKTFLCPDQDFLSHWFKGRWLNIGSEYNAIKTARYWHTELWDDDSVIVVHYIVDKPWKSRQAPNPDDQETHSWWWRLYDEMVVENPKLSVLEV